MEVLRVSNPVGSLLLGRAILLAALHEKEREMGIAHLVEHLVMRRLQIINRREPVHFNGYSHHVATIFGAESLPEKRSSILEELKKIEELEINEELLERERRVVLSEIRKDQQNPFVYLSILAYRTLFDGRLAHPVKGYEETVKSIEIEDVRRWMERLHEAESFLLLYEGEENDSRKPLRISIRFVRRNVKEERKGLKGVYLAVVWTAVNGPAPFLLMRYLSNRIGLEVRKLGTYAPSFTFALFPSERTPVLFRTRAPFPSEDTAEEAKNIVEKELEEIKEGKIDKSVFEKVKKLLELEERKTRYCKDISSVWNDALSLIALGKPREELLKDAAKLGEEGIIEVAQSLDRSRTAMLVPSG